MKLSLRVNAPEDSSGANDSDSSNISDYPDIAQYNFEGISRVLESELAEIFPASRNFEFAEVSLTFTTPQKIRELNKTYRGIDEPTDVLSFPIIEDEPVEIPELPVLALGDIVICPEETKRLHPELSEREGICLMIAHSFLHLQGHDHDTDEKQKAMWELQGKIAREILEVLR